MRRFAYHEFDETTVGRVRSRDPLVTVAHDVLAKALKIRSMDREGLSLDTVQMFANDAGKAEYRL